MKQLLSYENVRYGMLVEVMGEGGYHAGCKVHFYNKKGVLVGNYYKFVPYEMCFTRGSDRRKYPRYFYEKPFEQIQNKLFGIVLRFVDFLIRFTQSKMD